LQHLLSAQQSVVSHLQQEQGQTQHLFVEVFEAGAQQEVLHDLSSIIFIYIKAELLYLIYNNHFQNFLLLIIIIKLYKKAFLIPE
jgi:hypothetical protein